MWRNRSLRRLCLASAGFRLAELGVWIASTAYAYQAGGVGEASAVMVAQLVPATTFALGVGGLIRRDGAGPVLRWELAVQSAGMFVVAGFLHQGQNAAAFVGAIVAATAVTTTRPGPVGDDACDGRRARRVHGGQRLSWACSSRLRVSSGRGRGGAHDRGGHVGGVRVDGGRARGVGRGGVAVADGARPPVTKIPSR